MSLYICSTYYHVYITLLKLFSCRKPTETDLVICDDIPNGKHLADRIRSASLFAHVWFVEQCQLPQVPSKNWIDAIFFQHRRRAGILRPLLPFSVREYQDIYIYHDGTALGSYLNDEKCHYHLIEDSLNFYQYVYQSSQAHLMYPRNFRYAIRRMLRAGYFPLGDSHYLRDIEVNDRKNLQIKSAKIVEMPRTRLERNLTQDKVQLLFELFGYSPPKFSDIQSAIILTEPLFQDGMCGTLEEHHQIYQAITEYLLERNFCVYIKPHPRDTSDYTSYPAVVIDRHFPSELFKLHNAVAFDCAVAVSSSSLLTFPARQKYYWNITNNIPNDKLSERN